MFDNYFTKYENTKKFISEINARKISAELEMELKHGKLSAEKFAYLSKACVFAGENKKAVKYAKEAVKNDKNYPYGYIRLAFAYAKLGNKKECLKNCIIAENLDNNNYFNMAFLILLYRHCDMVEKSSEIFAKFKKLNDKSALYLYNLGFIYSSAFNDKTRAEVCFRDALSLGYKDLYNIYSNLAECYSELGDIEKADYFVERCLEFGETESMLSNKADCYIYEENYKEAKKVLHKIYKTTKNKQTVIIRLAQMYTKAGNKEKALKYYQFALDTTQANDTLYYAIAYCFENFAEYDKAIDMYKQMLVFNNNKAEIYANISYCYSKLGDKEKAYKAVEKALHYDKNSSYVHYRKGRILTEMKQYEEAIESFNNALDYDKSDTDCYQWISYCYSMLKEYEKSIEYANRAIILDKEDAYSYFRKAWALQELKRYSEAIHFYEECIKYNDKYIDAYVNISYIYSKTKDYKQSMLYANKALLLDKDYAYAHYRKAWALQETGKFEEAIDGYSKAMELDPTDIYNYLGIACVSLNTQANLNALLYANKAILLDRNCGGAYYYKSIALSNLGKSKEAERAFSIAQQLGYSPS